MGMMTGVLIIIAVLLVQITAAFIETETAETASLSGCTAEDNFTTCQQVSQTSFLAAIFDVSISGFDDAPDIVNVIWVTVMGILLVAGVIIIVSRFIPLIPGG